MRASSRPVTTAPKLASSGSTLKCSAMVRLLGTAIAQSERGRGPLPIAGEERIVAGATLEEIEPETVGVVQLEMLQAAVEHLDLGDRQARRDYALVIGLE